MNEEMNLKINFDNSILDKNISRKNLREKGLLNKDKLKLCELILDNGKYDVYLFKKITDCRMDEDCINVNIIHHVLVKNKDKHYEVPIRNITNKVYLTKKEFAKCILLAVYKII